MNTLSVILLLLYVAVTCSYAANITNKNTVAMCGQYQCHNGHCEIYSDGLHHCTCNAGWRGQSCALDVSEHNSGPCFHNCQHGKCVWYEPDRSRTCVCLQGWGGPNCNDKDLCEGYHCNHGQCHLNSDGHPHCTCDPGWKGRTCNKAENLSDNCSTLCHHGACKNNSNICLCDNGWNGTNCDIRALCGSRPCIHGACYYQPDGNNFCVCDSMWTGQSCDQALFFMTIPQTSTISTITATTTTAKPFTIAPTTTTITINTTSVPTIQSTLSPATNTSSTSSTTSMPSTAAPYPPCGSHPCMHGVCYYQSDGNNICVCENGWTGQSCDQALCGSQPCIHGVCYNQQDGNRICVCESWWTGQSCDQVAFPVPTTQMVTSTSSTTTATSTTSPTTTTTEFTLAPTSTTTTTISPTTTTMGFTTTTTTTITTTPAPTKQSTLAPAILTSSTSSTTSAPSTAVPYHYYRCQKLAVVNDIAFHTISSNINASVCATSGSHSSPEAFVLNHCNYMPTPQSWRQGLQVVADCNAFPHYIPIATFENGTYSASGGIAGIFLGCLPTGFKIGAQHCGQIPTIEHIEQGGLYIYNPDMYYMIQ